MGCCVSNCASAPHTREGWKCPILLQRKTNSFLLIWAWPSPKCRMHSPDGEHMEFSVLKNMLFWLPWLCQVAEWEQVRQLPSAGEARESAQNCKGASPTSLPAFVHALNPWLQMQFGAQDLLRKPCLKYAEQRVMEQENLITVPHSWSCVLLQNNTFASAECRGS